MLRSSDIRWVTAALCGFALTASTTLSQTNATSKWLSHEPPPSLEAITNAPADVATVDAQRFFEKYRQAAGQLAKGKKQEAGITMDLLARNLSTSPWLEIAMLKHAQLVELTNDRSAEQDYSLLRQRLTNAPYFQGRAERAKLFGAALLGAVDNGINRLRLRRVRDGISRYHARYGEYPESLAKVAILGYTDMENIHSVNNQLFRYVPQSPRMNPFISYQRFELEAAESEPFVATSPKLEATSQISEKPLKYSALINIPGRNDPARIAEDQTVQGYFVAAVTHDGAIVSTPTRVLVLVTP